jgi:DNA-binding NtrC family response regulator
VRIVCATNRDLPRMVKEARFRDDLYYRVGVRTIELPPLRSYRHNLEVLAQVFRKRACEQHRKHVAHISPAALALLLAYDFPGNVRELKNAIEHAVILAEGDTIEPAHLPKSLHPPPPQAKKKPKPKTLRELRDEWLAPFETRYLKELLDESGGHVRRAARQAGVDAVTMYRLLKKRGLRA